MIAANGGRPRLPSEHYRNLQLDSCCHRRRNTGRFDSDDFRNVAVPEMPCESLANLNQKLRVELVI